MTTPQHRIRCSRPMPASTRLWANAAYKPFTLAALRTVGWVEFGVFIVTILLGGSMPAAAHTQSTAFLTLRVRDATIDGEWHLALRDLEDAIGLDANEDGLITWDELRSRKEAVSAYAFSRLHIQSDAGQGILRMQDLLVDNHSDGAYAVLHFGVEGLGSPTALQVGYQAFFEIDPKHRGLLRLECGGSRSLAVFSPETSTQRFELRADRPTRIPFLSFVQQGIGHIWCGYDHILFLLALLLPGVLRRRDGAWEPVLAARPAVSNILKIVTAFTVAHSITLSLAALGAVRPPTRMIESAIAASVILAALNNLAPFWSENGWMIAFGFGLVHGFGFANALRDLGLQHAQIALPLVGFNLGVELGQLAIVSLFLPLALSLRRVLFYPRILLPLGSTVIMVISATWLTERVLNFKWLPF
jgi:hypothetical protein